MSIFTILEQPAAIPVTVSPILKKWLMIVLSYILYFFATLQAQFGLNCKIYQLNLSGNFLKDFGWGFNLP